jgi:UDPglucose 6-dehydrogenase
VGYDPVANDNAKEELGPTASIVDTMYDAVKDADAIVISTDWDEFKSPDFDKLKKLMRKPVIFDGRNLYRLADMQKQGFTYYSVGRAAVKAG